MKQLIVLIAMIILGTGIAVLVLNFGGTASTIASSSTQQVQSVLNDCKSFSVTTPTAVTLN